MFRLVIGDKHLSSWSLRPWILLKHLGVPFEEIRLALDTPQFRDDIGRHSPAGRVPVLVDGAVRVWDSIAICEYVNEISGGTAWPADPAARATARAVSAEMHAGFAALRSAWILKAASTGLEVPLDAEARADFARIESIWSECRRSFAAQGPWLFGGYSIADAMYAPIVLRFNTYGAQLSGGAREYFEFALRDPWLIEWIHGAEQELADEGRPAEHP
jgi:glutathione S-transferase